MRESGIDFEAYFGEAHLLEEFRGELRPAERDHGIDVAVALENGRGEETVELFELLRESRVQGKPRAERQHAAEASRAGKGRVEGGCASLREAADYDALARYAALDLLLNNIHHFETKNVLI